MKTTAEIQDALLERTRRHARRCGRSLRSLIEEVFRLVLQSEAASPPYALPDRSVGEAGSPNPLESLSWQDLRDEIYARR